MLNKELFKMEITDAYEMFEQKMPNTKVIKRMYEECIYLTDEEFKAGIKKMINNCSSVSIANIFHNLPKYTTMDKNGKRVIPPGTIDEYCEMYLKESYKKDKYREYIATLTPEEIKTLNKFQDRFNYQYMIKKEYLKELSKIDPDVLFEEYEEMEFRYEWGVTAFIEYKCTGKRPKIR